MSLAAELHATAERLLAAHAGHWLSADAGPFGCRARGLAATAQHEAGHAVVGRRLVGWPIASATIEPDGRALGCVRFEAVSPYAAPVDELRAHLAMSLSGDVAEQAFVDDVCGGVRPAPRPRVARPELRPVTSDLDAMVGRMAGPAVDTEAALGMFDRLRHELHGWLIEHRAELERIAFGLLQRGTLSGAEVDEALATELPGGAVRAWIAAREREHRAEQMRPRQETP